MPFQSFYNQFLLFLQQNAMSNILKIFIYGTLKRGQPNQHWLTNVANGYAKFLCVAQSIVPMPLIIASRFNIPFLLPFAGHGHRVKGEIYEIDEKMLSKLDVLEDYPTLYNREIQNFETDTGEIVPCIVYYLCYHPEKLLHYEHLAEYKDTPEKAYYCNEVEEFVDYSDLFKDFEK